MLVGGMSACELNLRTSAGKCSLALLGKDAVYEMTGSDLGSNMYSISSTLFFRKDFRVFPFLYFAVFVAGLLCFFGSRGRVVG
jgi:hypothetical protein